MRKAGAAAGSPDDRKGQPGAEPGRKKKAGTTPARERLLLKRELDSLVAHMQASGITYAEGVREFKKRFLSEVLARHRGNQCKAAAELGMHRNTLSRTIAELQLNPAQIRHGLKRPPRSERPAIVLKQTAGS
jgi:Fis family transcriptional regulator, factor for inversion stimulation protein